MTKFRNEVNGVSATLAKAAVDAEKFDNGNESAGRRARVAMGAISTRCKELRQEMIAVTKAREEARFEAATNKKAARGRK